MNPQTTYTRPGITVTINAPRSHQRNDADIAAAAKVLLDWAVTVPSNSVQISVRDGVITLFGHVTWAYQRDAAARAVAYMNGARGLHNAITVTTAPTSPRG